MAKRFPKLLALCGVLFLGSSVFLGASAAETRPSRQTACAYLADQVDQAPPGPLFLPSYPTAEPGPLHGTAFLDDNAVAARALVGCGAKDKAGRIGAAILWAMENDRVWRDGRLRNAYAAGPLGKGPAKLAGWWDAGQNKWLEDGYQVGSDTGNMAWAMLALLAVDETGARTRFRDGAARLGTWITRWSDKRAPVGFTGGTFGHEPTPTVHMWKSTEHNTDLAAAFALLAARTGEPRWRDMTGRARQFVEAMWNPGCGCFAAGTGADGVTRNLTFALDAQIWPLTALPGAAKKYMPAIASAEKRLGVSGGFAYGEDRNGVWTEGTAQAALLLKLLGQTEKAKVLATTIESQRAPDGGFYATSANALATGFGLDTDPTKPRLYFKLPHLGAVSWVALQEQAFNPFTATKTLP